jgi:hypothetical protein
MLEDEYPIAPHRHAAQPCLPCITGKSNIACHWSQYDVRLNVLNLGNKNYYDALMQSDGRRPVPGIGRTALLTASYRF